MIEQLSSKRDKGVIWLKKSFSESAFIIFQDSNNHKTFSYRIIKFQNRQKNFSCVEGYQQSGRFSVRPSLQSSHIYHSIQKSI